MIELTYSFMTILSVCMLVGLAFFSVSQKPVKLIFIYVFITFIVEWIGFYSLQISEQKTVNNQIYKLHTLLEFIIISSYFYFIIINKILKKIILWLIPIVLISLIIIIYWKILPMHRMFLISIFFFVFYSILYFKQLLDSDNNILSNPNFWIVTGILFFNAGFFFLSGFVTYISEKDRLLATKLFSINHLLNIVYYSLITYGFICQRRLAKSSL